MPTESISTSRTDAPRCEIICKHSSMQAKPNAKAEEHITVTFMLLISRAKSAANSKNKTKNSNICAAFLTAISATASALPLKPNELNMRRKKPSAA